MNAAEQGNENQARGTHRLQEVNNHHITVVAGILLPVPLLDKYILLPLEWYLKKAVFSMIIALPGSFSQSFESLSPHPASARKRRKPLMQSRLQRALFLRAGSSSLPR
jgi:hypothetical protein